MTTVKPSLPRRKKIVLIIVNVLLLLVFIAGVIWAVRHYSGMGDPLYTNDAQVEEYISPLNTRIPGYIREVRFREHQSVKKGDTLLIIEDREYHIQVLQAEAALLSAQAARNVTHSGVNTVASNREIVSANITASQARLVNAEQNFNRYQHLLAEGAATQQQFDMATAEYHFLKAQQQALEKQLVSTGLSVQETSNRVMVSDAEIKRAMAALEMAKLNLSYTVITAPCDGVTGRRHIQEGQLLQAGQPLTTIARNDAKWIIANFKESQYAHIREGAMVMLKIDGLPGEQLRGRISSISEATGSRYSTIPVDNSTGNFVKVQQRIPVRIEIMADPIRPVNLLLLKAGMNVVVKSLKP